MRKLFIAINVTDTTDVVNKINFFREYVIKPYLKKNKNVEYRFFIPNIDNKNAIIAMNKDLVAINCDKENDSDSPIYMKSLFKYIDETFEYDYIFNCSYNTFLNFSAIDLEQDVYRYDYTGFGRDNDSNSLKVVDTNNMFISKTIVEKILADADTIGDYGLAASEFSLYLFLNHYGLYDNRNEMNSRIIKFNKIASNDINSVFAIDANEVEYSVYSFVFKNISNILENSEFENCEDSYLIEFNNNGDYLTDSTLKVNPEGKFYSIGYDITGSLSKTDNTITITFDGSDPIELKYDNIADAYCSERYFYFTKKIISYNSTRSYFIHSVWKRYMNITSFGFVYYNDSDDNATVIKKTGDDIYIKWNKWGVERYRQYNKNGVYFMLPILNVRTNNLDPDNYVDIAGRTVHCFHVNEFLFDTELPYHVIMCIKSFLNAGCKFKLYTYQEFENLPEGVEVVDARTVIPFEEAYNNKYDCKYTNLKNLETIFKVKLLEQNQSGIFVSPDMMLVSNRIPKLNYQFIISNGEVDPSFFFFNPEEKKQAEVIKFICNYINNISEINRFDTIEVKTLKNDLKEGKITEVDFYNKLKRPIGDWLFTKAFNEFRMFSMIRNLGEPYMKTIPEKYKKMYYLLYILDEEELKRVYKVENVTNIVKNLTVTDKNLYNNLNHNSLAGKNY